MYKKDLLKEADRLTKKIVRKIKPEKVILFGSLAYGNYHADSDVDLLVIKKTSLLPWERSQWVSGAVLDRRIGLDAIVYTPKEVVEKLGKGDIFLKEIFEEGKVLYEKKK